METEKPIEEMPLNALLRVLHPLKEVSDEERGNAEGKTLISTQDLPSVRYNILSDVFHRED